MKYKTIFGTFVATYISATLILSVFVSFVLLIAFKFISGEQFWEPKNTTYTVVTNREIIVGLTNIERFPSSVEFKNENGAIRATRIFNNERQNDNK